LRIPAGQLKSFQLRELSRIAAELTTGYVQITTRANLQMRMIQPRDVPALLGRIQNIGLHTRGAGADNIRNITASPTAGIDPFELIDVLPFCHELSQLIISSREFYNLPRKFNIAFDGGGLISSVEETNDVGASAVEIVGDEGPVPAGVYFRIKLGGATGHLAFAQDLGVLVKPSELVKTMSALVRVFINLGNRTDRKRARLKWLLETMSLEQYLVHAEKLLGFKLLRSPLDPAKAPVTGKVPVRPHPQVGVYAQKQKGLNYIGVGIPVGTITPRQMNRIAEIADLYGSGEVRLTVWQNLIIPNIPDAFVETVKKAVAQQGLHWQQSHIRSGLVACTGNSYCKFAASNTKSHALELVDYLEKKVKLDQPLNIHVTGCPNSCAQHYMGDIGLLGTKTKLGGESVEGYHVFIGGGFGDNQALGRQVFSGISFNQLKPTLEKMLKGYLRHRQAGETFLSFSKRNDLNTLQAIFSNDE
ncbi:MAG: precorrin-3B synthase, partial [Verrucomicrobiales bacterium]|nr:precorrin-3B synthase [Verrucomicrobiales bacterium]